MTLKLSQPPPAPRVAALSPTSFLAVFEATPLQRIALVKSGMKARDAKAILARLAIPQGRTFEALKVSQATVNKKAAQDLLLSASETERLLGVAKLVGQVQSMVAESGRPDGFDAPSWLSSWLVEPLPALGGERPVDLMDTMEGQTLVSNLLAQMQSGAYA